MFYKMITNARDIWLTSPTCSIKSLINYMENKGCLRDAQIDAIKTYLYLKIACNCRPLKDLFSEGTFNTLELEDEEISSKVRNYLIENPAAAALYEYSRLKNDNDEQVSEKIETQIKTEPDSIEYKSFFEDVFYKTSYTDYLFSLPMGAGKTFLMAAFIYLDLYFAMNEPNNLAFAHNFIVFAPSGLKSSVVPSLKTIQNFDPTWVIPEPAATNVKRMLSFEVLDQGKTDNKSNKTKNPNVQKIANHQPLSDLFGLVAVTNAEKVILDRVKIENGQISLFEETDDEKDRQANELRNLIGKLPGLSVFIDEVHHATSRSDKSDEKKLRAVVNSWAKNKTLNSVIGFSGTPYLDKAEKFEVADKLRVANAEISNIVYYYPLIKGVGNFLKRPVVKISDVADSGRIIELGVREFLNSYKDRVYEGGLTAKLGIYCGTIEKLEEVVYPIVSGIVAEYGLDSSCILKFYRESSSKDKNKKKYIAPADSQMQFDTLDKSFSKIRIVLLVQIGKEGWDCHSLTGIILSQEGDCPKNMVLQTSCRCLRQVEKNQEETALIYLNSSNADKLNNQLQQQHHISLKEFADADHHKVEIRRYDRTKHLKLPKIDFYQLKINYETLITEPANPAKQIPTATKDTLIADGVIKTTDFEMKTISTDFDDDERGNVQATFITWLYKIVKGSFGSIKMPVLEEYSEALEKIFKRVTYERDGNRYYSSHYDQQAVMSNIRKAFCEKRSFETREEKIPQTASLLNISNFIDTVYTEFPDEFYPEQDTVEKIILDDKGKLKPDKKTLDTIEALKSLGQTELAETLRGKTISHPQKDHSFHYLPYHTDSSFEQTFLSEILTLPEIGKLGIEVYYNGDRAMTEFKIKCYKRSGNQWQYVGMYTPDFVLIQRKDDKIYKIIIVETKGEIYGEDPVFLKKKDFMETEFGKLNNEAFGYERFDYLYVEDTLTEKERLNLVHDKMCEFFEEV